MATSMYNKQNTKAKANSKPKDENRTDAALESILEPADSKAADIIHGTVNALKLNVRNKTSKERGVVLQVIDEGTVVNILDDLGEWYKVSVNGIDGFCMKQFITVK